MFRSLYYRIPISGLRGLGSGVPGLDRLFTASCPWGPKIASIDCVTKPQPLSGRLEVQNVCVLNRTLI